MRITIFAPPSLPPAAHVIAVPRRLIADPYRSGTSLGHRRLAALLKPIMWRCSKQVAAHDHPLPRRTLQVG